MKRKGKKRGGGVSRAIDYTKWNLAFSLKTLQITAVSDNYLIMNVKNSLINGSQHSFLKEN